MSKWLKSVWNNINMTPAERYLSQAKDRFDLEQRMNNLRYGKVKL